MTILAGAFARHPGDEIPATLRDSLRQAVSRHPGEVLIAAGDGRCLLLKADVGAFGAPGHHEDADAISFLAGEPLLARGEDAGRSRADDLRDIHGDLIRGELSGLATARGVFAIAQYRPAHGTLTLATDKLGIRPIHYWAGERYVVFASALRILEQVPDVAKTMDLRGVTEQSAFGFALADRSGYSAIKVMLPAEVVEVRGAALSRRRYWSWDTIGPSDHPLPELAAQCYRRFTEAVAVRNRDDRATSAFLSGGLDSRAVVAALRMRGTAVHTFNFALSGTQDQVFGADFARQVGTTHVEAPMRPGHPAWSLMMAQAQRQFPPGAGEEPERPRVVWSGDGGSVALGHVYLKRSHAALARAGRRDELAEAMNRDWGAEVPARLMQPAMTQQLRGVTRQGLREEFDSIRSTDAARAVHLLLMFNDQRRHLAMHFEDIDLHRLEFQLPFFDSDFVASVIEVPLDACIGHAFYMQWLRHFPAVTLSVPWQAYPGHEPCPLPVAPELDYQWDRARSRQLLAAYRRNLVEETRAVLGATDFPHVLLKRRFLRLATWLHRLGIRDLAHVLRTANTYYRYWSRSGGRLG